ncbi:MAG: hypothetical protein HFJ12_01300 [Bacilli bacterium]|nr:hypothetical protein [Bacilli bacterium]
MNNDDILKEINNYMNNPLSYALLLEGNWGSGKTYFIQNKINKIDNIYISLYGVNSISNLSFQLCCELAKDTNNGYVSKLFSIKKGNKAISTIGSILVSNIENKFNFSFKEVLSLIEDVDLRKKLLIFDDLERSSMPIDEVLGFINNLVEHNKIKVLIVANEQEISDKSNYLKFKEKLIYQTFKYIPNLQNIYNTLSKKESNIVIENEKFVIKEFKRKNHYNIRTLQFIIQRYKELELELEDILLKIDNVDVVNTIKNELFQYLVIVAREYKMGNTLPEFKDDTEISSYLLAARSYSGITSFKFINDFILGYQLDINLIEDILINYSCDIVSSLKGDNNPLQILNYWWEVEDDVIKDSNNNILERLQKNEYSFSLYPKILAYFVNVSKSGFGNDILDTCFKFMKKNIIESEKEVTIRYRILDIPNEYIKEDFNKLKMELNNIIEIHNKTINENTFLLSRKQKVGKKGSYLYNICMDNKSTFLNKKTFIEIVENENIIYLVKNGNSTDIRNLIYLFNEIYQYANVKDLYPSDLPILEELVKLLKKCKLNQFSLMKKFNYDSFIECIENIIIMLKS